MSSWPSAGMPHACALRATGHGARPVDHTRGGARGNGGIAGARTALRSRPGGPRRAVPWRRGSRKVCVAVLYEPRPSEQQHPVDFGKASLPTEDFHRPCGDCSIPYQGYTSDKVTVYDQVAGRPVDCIVSSHLTPAGSPFESSKGKLWTLEVRLERNTVRLGHAVVCLSPSASNWRLEDATVCDIANYDTGRFRGVGTALIGCLVHSNWRDGQQVKLDKIIAEDVEEHSLRFWHRLGFHFSEGVEDFGGNYDTPEALDTLLDDVVDYCEFASPVVTSCVKEEAFRITGHHHTMHCTMRDYWQ